jgi:nitrite reductase/ring-hydroxylating ferredoxin subunit
VNATDGWVLLFTADPVVVRGVHKAAATADLRVVAANEVTDDAPAVIVVDLEQPGAIDSVAELRADHADAILVGHLSRPDPERWVKAERAGCDVVANRGAVGRTLRDHLRADTPRRRRFPLLDESDVAGRLGFVERIGETPVGPVGVYHVDGNLTAVEDVCPHSGAELSAGVVAGCVVTCPRHGSQFDVTTGERLRGPSDQDVVVHQVVRDGGRVQMVWL